MDFVLMIRFYAGVAALGMTLFSPFVLSASVPLNLGGDLLMYPDGSMTMKTPTTAALVDSLTSPPSIKYTAPIPQSIPTSKGVKSVGLPDLALMVDKSKILSAAGLLLRYSPYVGAAVSAWGIFCNYTTVCHLPGYDLPQKVISTPTSTVSRDCSNTSFDQQYYKTDTHILFWRINSYNHCGGSLPSGWTATGTYCAVSGGACSYETIVYKSVPTAPPSTNRDATDADFATAYATPISDLSHINVLSHYVDDQKKPLPVLAPTFSPVTAPVEHTEQTVRDGTGTATGTSVTDTTIKIEPIPLKSGYAKTTETVTNTTTNITNNTTNTTSTVNSTPDGTPPEKLWPTIEIDEVPDVNLPTYTPPVTFSTTSWGTATCPADPSITLRGHIFAIPLHTVCNGLAQLRPIIILLAFLCAAYIISGVKFD